MLLTESAKALEIIVVVPHVIESAKALEIIAVVPHVIPVFV